MAESAGAERFPDRMSRTLSIGFDSSGREYRRLETTPNAPGKQYAAIGHRRVRFEFIG